VTHPEWAALVRRLDPPEITLLVAADRWRREVGREVATTL
jgi:hypothetical protein